MISYGYVATMCDLNAKMGQRHCFALDSQPYETFIYPLISVDDNFSFKLKTARASMDPEVNQSGLTLLDICKGADMNICNGRLFGGADIGQYTFISKRGCSLLVMYCYHLLRYRMAGITESAMVAYTHKYAEV